MDWMILNEDGNNGQPKPDNKSHHARYRKRKLLLGVLQRYNSLQGDYSKCLREYVRRWNFDFDKDAGLIDGDGGLATLINWVDPRNATFLAELRIVLEDIARVVEAAKIKPNPPLGQPKSQWFLRDYGGVYTYLMHPFDNNGATRYRRVEIILDKGYTDTKSMPSHFHHWVIEYTSLASKELGVSLEIRKDAIKKIAKVSGKVWILEGQTPNEKLVIKFESLDRGGKPQSLIRLKWVNWLARKAFIGLPRYAPLSDRELASLADLKSPETCKEGLPDQTLAAFLADPLVKPYLATQYGAYKIQPLEVAPNLEECIFLMNKMKNLDAQEQYRSRFREFFFVKDKMSDLGRIAVFDQVVTNKDRFWASEEKRGIEIVSVGVTNIDFTTSGEIIALDNFDPSGLPLSSDNWHGEKTLTTEGGCLSYAKATLDCLIKFTGTENYYTTHQKELEGLVEAFREGMMLGALTLKSFLEELKDETKRERSQPDRQQPNELARRIEIMKA